MINTEFYLTIEKESVAGFKDRGSRFIAYAFPVIDAAVFKKRLKQLKEEHPKANHHCFAYRIGTKGDNFRVGDDGEPSGSAGRPILGQIDSRQLTNTAVVVVRYFGGTLLGVPGLINAYKTSTSLALQTTPIIKKAIEIEYCLRFDYTKMNEVMTVMRKYNCRISRQEQLLFCELQVGIPKAVLSACLAKLKDIQGLEIEESQG